MKRRPFCQAAAAFLAGLCMRAAGNTAWLMVFLPAVALCLCWGRIRRTQRYGLRLPNVLLLFGFYIAGAALMHRAATPPKQWEAWKEGIPITITGRIQEYEWRDDQFICRIKTDSHYHQIRVSANLTSNPFPTNTTNQFIGALVEVCGVPETFEEPTNRGQFSMRAYYKSQNIDIVIRKARLTVKETGNARIQNALWKLRQAASACLQSLLPGEDGKLLSAMLLGDKSGLSAETKELYQRNGISHVLAISGLHISVIGMGLFTLLRGLGCSLQTAGVLGSLCTIAFGLMTGMSVSTMRALIMYLTAMTAKIIGRTYDLPSALALACMLVLADRPYALFQSSMQFSFGAILSFVLFAEAWEKPVPSKSWMSRIVTKRIAAGLKSSVGIQLVTMPLQFYHLFYVPIYSSLLNLLVLPGMSVVLPLGLVAVGVDFLAERMNLWSFGMRMSFALQEVARFLLVPVRLLFAMYRKLCEWTQQLPGNLLVAGRPALWQLAAAYGLLAAALWLIHKYKKAMEGNKTNQVSDAGKEKHVVFTKRLALAAPAGILALCACLMWLCLRPVSFRGLTITMLDVGQGACTCIELPDRTTILVDGGSTDVQAVGTYRILPHLLSGGIRIVDAVLVSHWDADHISGIEELLKKNGQEIVIRQLVLPDAAQKDEVFYKLQNQAIQKGIAVSYVKAGDVWQNDTVTLCCLSPSKQLHAKDRNGYSAVYRLEYGEFCMLLPGDLPAENEEVLLEAENLHAQLYQVAHHGSAYASSEELLQRVEPVMAWISCGKENRYGHPHPELLKRLERMGVRIYCTAKDGAICIQVRKDGSYRLYRTKNPASRILLGCDFMQSVLCPIGHSVLQNKKGMSVLLKYMNDLGVV